MSTKSEQFPTTKAQSRPVHLSQINYDVTELWFHYTDAYPYRMPTMGILHECKIHWDSLNKSNTITFDDWWEDNFLFKHLIVDRYHDFEI